MFCFCFNFWMNVNKNNLVTGSFNAFVTWLEVTQTIDWNDAIVFELFIYNKLLNFIKSNLQSHIYKAVYLFPLEEILFESLINSGIIDNNQMIREREKNGCDFSKNISN